MSALLVVAAMPSELPRGLHALGVAGIVTGVRASRLPPGGLPGTGPVLVTGTCGALVPGMRLGTLVLAGAVAARGGLLEPPANMNVAIAGAAEEVGLTLRRARFAHADHVVDGSERGRLAEATGAEVVDLETAIIAQACEAAGRPWAALRFVTDTPEAPLTWLAELLGGMPEEEPPLSRVLAGLARRPGSLPALLALGALVSRRRAHVREVVQGLV